jgi:hypothetical protein
MQYFEQHFRSLFANSKAMKTDVFSVSPYRKFVTCVKLRLCMPQICLPSNPRQVSISNNLNIDKTRTNNSSNDLET